MPPIKINETSVAEPLLRHSFQEFIDSKIGIVCYSSLELQFVLEVCQINGMTLSLGLLATRLTGIIFPSKSSPVELLFGFHKITVNESAPKTVSFTSNIAFLRKSLPDLFPPINFAAMEWSEVYLQDMQQSWLTEFVNPLRL